MFDCIPHEFPEERYKTEIWSSITDSDVSGVIPNRYQISTYGRLLDNATGNIYPTGMANEDKYPNHVFKLSDGKSITVNLHYLVAHKFKPLRPVESDAIDGRSRCRRL